MRNTRDINVCRVASFLMWLNIRTQKRKAALFFFFFFITAMVSFFFIGDLLMNADDRISMKYDDSVFSGEDRTRIVAKRQDGKPITEQDMDAIRSLHHVVTVDQYDNVDDINFYYQKDIDYQLQYGYIDEEEEDIEGIEFLDNSHYMRSSTCIRQEDLAAGRLPQKRGEVVLYSGEGEKAISTTFSAYLRHRPLWGDGDYVQWDFTVVGVLREETDQLYFSPAMCQMLTTMLNCSRFSMTFFFDKYAGEYLGHDDFIPLIGEGLTGDELQVSRNYIVPDDKKNSKLSQRPEYVFNHSPVYLWFKDYLEVFQRDSQGEWRGPVKLNGHNVKIENLHLSSGAFLAMSEEWFTQYNDTNNYQASVYITSYAKTTEVLKALRDVGYDAVSTYRAGTQEYDQEKVKNRLIHIIIALVVLLVALIAEILILGSLMKLHCGDYYVWKFIGMDKKLMHRIDYYEMAFYLLASMIFTIVAVQYAKTQFSWLQEMCYYYEIPGCLCFVIYNLVAGVLTVEAFHYFLERKIL